MNTRPENSYFEGNHLSNLLIKDNFSYKDALEKFKSASFLNKGLTKKTYKIQASNQSLHFIIVLLKLIIPEMVIQFII